MRGNSARIRLSFVRPNASLQPIAGAARPQQLLGICALEHGERGQRPCLRARVGSYGDRSRSVRDRPTGAGIQYVRVAAALVHDEPARIAARREPASVQVHEACGRAAAIRRFDADPPRLTVTPRRARDDVAAEVDQAAQVRSNAFDLRCGQVDGVLLADAAKVDLHARLQLQYGFAPLHAMPAGQLQNGVDLRLRRHATAAVERPHSAQDAGGDVEAPLRKPGERRGEVDEAGRFLIEYDGATVARVDLVNDVVIAIATELALDAPGTARGRLDDAGARAARAPLR